MAGLQKMPTAIALLAVLLFAAIYVAPLGLRPLSNPDEVRYGAISHEMIASGDWVSPHLNGVRYFEKPILGYWLNSISMSALGENRVALRLPAAMATGLTALIVFLLTVRFASSFSAFLASGIYLTTFLVLGVGTMALLDAFLALFLTGALAAYYSALAEKRPPGRSLFLAVCGACCAGAFLTKGFLGLAIPVLVVIPYLVVSRNWRALITSGWIPVLTAALLIVPWAVLIHLREPDFWHYFFWVEHIQRFAGEEAQHASPFWYYFGFLPLAGWPWIWILPAALSGLRRLSERKDFQRYLIAWVLLPWLFFSVSKGKLITYVLPCFAPLSILLAVGLEQYFRSGLDRAWRVGAAAIGLMMAAGIALLALAQAGVFGDAPYGLDEAVQAGLVLGCLGIGVVAAILAAWFRRGVWRCTAIAVTGVVLFLPLLAGLPRRVLENVMPQDFVPADVLGNSNVVLVSDAPMFGAVEWYSKRNDIYVLQPGEIAYGLSYPDSLQRDLRDGRLAALIEDSRGRHDIVIICREVTAREIRSLLPERASRQQIGRVVVWRIPA